MIYKGALRKLAIYDLYLVKKVTIYAIYLVSKEGNLL